ncbi:MAG: NTP transferase domain-containing protein [Crocinitomicaceae bacterium]|nr:NTP transferase domain-containing protein [Crocinitomicaceae bacterium]
MGLRHIRQAKYVFIQNVDAPFLQTSTLLEMIKSAEPETTILPRFKTSNGHPVLADAEMLRNLLKNADESSSLKQLISGCKRKIVETDDNGILINVNTPNEYDKVMHEYMA